MKKLLILSLLGVIGLTGCGLGAYNPNPISRTGFYASSTSKNFTLTASDVCSNAVITVTPYLSSADSFNITMPSTSTVDSTCLTNNGMTLDFQYINGSGVSSTTILVGNTDYMFNTLASSTAPTTIQAGSRAYVKCYRNATKYGCNIWKFNAPINY